MFDKLRVWWTLDTAAEQDRADGNGDTPMPGSGVGTR